VAARPVQIGVGAEVGGVLVAMATGGRVSRGREGGRRGVVRVESVRVGALVALIRAGRFLARVDGVEGGEVGAFAAGAGREGRVVVGGVVGRCQRWVIAIQNKCNYLIYCQLLSFFFNCVHFIGLVVKRKVHNGGSVFKNLKYIF